MHAEGIMQKMRIAPGEPVQYSLRLDALELPLNRHVGDVVRLEYLGRIICQNCGDRSRKSYGQGYCYPCFKKLARCDLCVMSPDRCHYDQGTCREPEWADGFCMQPHTVYLATSSGPKVGITKLGFEFERWTDQGAHQAVRLLRATTRKAAGIAEVALTEAVSDRTQWRGLVSGPPPEVDLMQLAADVRAEFESRLTEVEWLDAAAVDGFSYPVDSYSAPTRAQLVRDGIVEGRLRGIKGQFLLFDDCALNIRSLNGHAVKVSARPATDADLAPKPAPAGEQQSLF